MKDSPSASRREKIRFSASIVCVRPFSYGETVEKLDRAGVDGYHFDMCDGQFAPTLLGSYDLISDFKRHTQNRLDIHLYCRHPSVFIEEFAKAGADTVIVMHESEDDIPPILERIRSLGMRPGIGILPNSEADSDLLDYLPVCDMVIVNMVGPAYPGQPENLKGLDNLEKVTAEVEKKNLSIEVGVDGKFRREKLRPYFDAGLTHFVCGASSIFIAGTDIAENLRNLRNDADSLQPKIGKNRLL